MPRYSSDEEKIDKLKKNLESAGHYSKLLIVVERIFQRVPELVQELEDQVEEEGGGMVVRKKRLAELVVDKVVELCENVEYALEVGLPSRFSNYLTYTELVLLRVKSENSSGRQWSVFKLRNYPPREDTELRIDDETWLLRTKLKSELKNLGHMAAIQTEGVDNRIWVRTASVKASKNKEKDKKKLENTRPAFIVHYPGEPYFYSTGNLSEVLQSALVACLGCEGARKLELSGKCLTSLRNLRLGKDARDGQARQEARTVPDRFSVLNKEAEAGTGETSHPKLETVTLNISGERLETPLSCGVTIAGRDVIGGLEDLVRAGVIGSPAPQWVRDLSTAGRNKFKMEALSRVYRDDDMDSVLSKAWV